MVFEIQNIVGNTLVSSENDTSVILIIWSSIYRFLIYLEQKRSNWMQKEKLKMQSYTEAS